jgi:hypothetical protein
MATGNVLLTPGGATFPDGSASNAAPGLVRVKSSAAAPGPYYLQLNFDPTTEQWCTWSFPMPDDYASGPIAKVHYKMASAITGGVAWDVRLAAVSDGDAVSVNAKAFAAANVATAAAVPGTVGYIDVVSVALANADSLAAGDFVVVRLARAVANAADTAAGNAEFLGMSLSYTTV